MVKFHVDSKTMQELKEFKFKIGKNGVEHSLFIRKHVVREKVAEKPPDRTLFVTSVPPYLNTDSLSQIFEGFGNVKSIYIHKTPNAKVPQVETSNYFKTEPSIEGYKVAYVVFASANNIDNVLNSNRTLVIKEDAIYSGLKKWAYEYNSGIPNSDKLEKEVQEFMEKFDKEEEEKQKVEKGMAEEDDEGWVTVTKKGRHPGISRKESVKLKSEQNRKSKQLVNFYRFQIKEAKMKNLVELRQKYEEDKKRIAAMKASRKFLLKL